MTRDVIVRTSADRLRKLLDGNRDELRLDVISPGTRPVKLRDVDLGMQCDIAGIVRSTDDITVFDRDDGGEGQVRGIRIQDSTADIRCALWGDHAEELLEIGDPVLLRNVEIKDGFQDDIEASVGWSSEVEELEDVEIDYVTVQLREHESDDGIDSDESDDGADANGADDSSGNDTPTGLVDDAELSESGVGEADVRAELDGLESLDDSERQTDIDTGETNE
jgi:replication factor A1